MSRIDDFWGKKDPEVMFGNRPLTMAPWPPAGRRKDRQDYDKSAVESALRGKQEPEPIDPRELRSTQPNITYAGVKHYIDSSEVYKDRDNAGNRNPVVYERNGERMILSGHHRAAKALLHGEQFNAVVVRGDWGPPR